MERIELKGWNREKLFRMYQDSDLPYIIFSARVDVTRLLAHVRARGFSFSAALPSAAPARPTALIISATASTRKAPTASAATWLS